ncbi:unnamed protein product [Symbiodinium natans]|uniref:Ion transport domain-containing protein n=1 Tax=Symbiodinium natans TaxID=878477 RepID=A0A812J8D1_9DINO|nr:unnamed protein product [Symbiodinium natans]
MLTGPGRPVLECEASDILSHTSLPADVDPNPHDRWHSLTAKVLEAAGIMGAFDTPKAKPRTTTGIMSELKMRAVWSVSLVQTKATYQRSQSHIAALGEMSSLKINDAFTDTSFLQRFVVGPHSKHQLVWAIIASVFIIWDLITIPLEMFDVAEFIRVLDTVGMVTLSFWAVDMPLHLIFGVQLRGSLEMRPRKLWSLYMRSWFATDLLIVLLDVGLIIMENLSTGQSSGAFRSARFLRSLRLLRLFRLVRVAKLQRELSLVASRFLSTYAFMVMKIVAALLMMVAINHIIGCCWYGIALGTGSDKTWVHRSGIEDADFGTSYVYSIHWALTQFTPSTNNIAPENGGERFFAIWVILLAMGVYSSFIGSISSTVNSLRAVRGEKIKQQSKLLQFFIERNLSLDLYGSIQETLRREGTVEVRLKEDEVNLISGLPERFKQQLHEELYIAAMQRLPFWPSWSEGQSTDRFFFSSLCHHAVSECVLMPGEDAFMPGTSCEHVYIVESGFMNYSLGNQDPSEIERDAILCLTCFWSEWQHAGRLSANSGTSYYITVNSEEFCKIAMRFGGRLSLYLQVFGILIVGAVESQHEQGVVTDLCFDWQRIEELASRAERFHSIFESLDNTALQSTSLQAKITMVTAAPTPASPRAAHWDHSGNRAQLAMDTWI